MNEHNLLIKCPKFLDSDKWSLFGDEIIQYTGFVNLTCG